jgi:tetratricopeptide (TPR) repeat protein
MIYAHLQMAQEQEAKRIVDEALAYQKLHDMTKDPIAAQTGFAAIPARYVLERKAWQEADGLEVIQKTWAYAEAMSRFTRALGASRTGELAKAQEEIRVLGALRAAAVQGKQDYWDSQIEVLLLAASGWLSNAQGKNDEAVRLMRRAADLEDASEKHIAMENRLYPMRELLADMLLESGQAEIALREYTTALESTPNRFNAFYGAARAAELSGEKRLAREYYQRLLALSKKTVSERPELVKAQQFIFAR